MTLNPLNSSNLDQLALKGVKVYYLFKANKDFDCFIDNTLCLKKVPTFKLCIFVNS